MLEVHTWEPNANSGKPLFCLHEKSAPFTCHSVGMGAHERHGPEFLAINPDGTIDVAVIPLVAPFGALGLPLPGAVGRWRERVAGRPSVEGIREDLFPVAVMGPEPGRWG